MRLILIACLVGLLGAVVWGVSPNSHPFGLNENQPYGRLTNAYVTPHVKWAKPYAGGNIRALVLAPEWSQRETVELAQRLSLDYTAWMSYSFTKLTGNSADPAFAFFLPPLTLVSKLLADNLKQDYDVYIIGKLEWTMLPAQQRFALLEKVSNGAGLVYVNPPNTHKELEIVLGETSNPDGAAYILSNLPISGLSGVKGIAPGDLVKATPFGNGRVVVVDYQENIPLQPEKEARSFGWPCLTPMWQHEDPKRGWYPLETLPAQEWVNYEYYMALIARAVLWAGHKEPRTQLQPLQVPVSIPWGAPTTILPKLTNAPVKAQVRAVVRDAADYETTYALGTQPAEHVAFTLPTLPAGQYFLDVWVLAPGGKAILTWGSAAFMVTSNFPLGAITLDKGQYDRGEQVSGKIALPRALGKGETLAVSLWDTWGRKVAEASPMVTEQSATFTLPPLQPLAIMHTVHASLLRNGKVVSTASLLFPVRAKLRLDDFNEIVWGGMRNTPITQQMLRKLAREDQADAYDICFSGATAARNVGLVNLMPLPYSDRFGPLGGNNRHIVAAKEGEAYGCMSHPLTLKALKDRMEGHARIYSAYGTIGYTHGDETSYSSDPDVCWCPSCLEKFRGDLKQSYGDLPALNADWGTAYTAWEQVMPVTYKEAKATKRYAPWVEHRMTSDRTIAEFYNASQDDLRAAGDTGARAGFDGVGDSRHPNHGHDWWQLTQKIDVIQSYRYNGASAMQMFRSFLRPGTLSGMWYGTYGITWSIGPNTVEFCHGFPWESVLHGLNSTWFWMMGEPGPVSGYAPDLTSLPFFAARAQSLKEIKSGIGKLLLSGTRQTDGVYLHYSEASRIADSLFAEHGDEWGRKWVKATSGMNLTLDDNGLSYEYLATPQLEGGELAKRPCRVFIMMHSHAVSGKEAAAIRQFVQQGGVLIADIVPGTLNGHGALQQTGMLADLFPTDQPGAVTLFGKGKTILIGDMVQSYTDPRNAQTGWKPLEGRWLKFGELLQREAGLTAPVTVTPTNGTLMPPTDISRFRCGEIEFVGLLRDYFLWDYAPYAAQITFPRKTHLYDVRAGKYLGVTDTVQTPISYETKLYALSPYKVTGLEITTAGKTAPGSATTVNITVQVEKGAASRHGIRLEVLAPDGTLLACYAQNLLAEGGKATATIPWALNEKPGRYTLTARDVMSGTVAMKIVDIR